MDRDSAEPRTTETPPQPDTEPSSPLTPAGDHISVDVVQASELDAKATDDASAELARSQAATRDAISNLSVTQQSPLTRMESTKAPLPLKGDSNTTLQSMKRPEVAASGVTQTRRFLSIERDLEQMNAALKLLEKRCTRAENSAKLAWIAAGIAGALGLLGTLL